MGKFSWGVPGFPACLQRSVLACALLGVSRESDKVLEILDHSGSQHFNSVGVPNHVAMFSTVFDLYC